MAKKIKKIKVKKEENNKKSTSESLTPSKTFSKTFQCGGCGVNINYHFGQSESLTCPSCGARYDCVRREKIIINCRCGRKANLRFDKNTKTFYTTCYFCGRVFDVIWANNVLYLYKLKERPIPMLYPCQCGERGTGELGKFYTCTSCGQRFRVYYRQGKYLGYFLNMDSYNALAAKTSGFEKTRNKRGKPIISNQEVVDSVCCVDLAISMIRELKLYKLEFKNIRTGFGGQSYNTKQGRYIQVHAEGATSRDRAIYTIFHEIGESYYHDRLFANKDRQAWTNFLRSTPKENLNKVERGEVKGKNPIGEHFGRCFAEYCQAVLAAKEENDKELLEWFKEDRPGRYEFFENLLGEIKEPI